MTSESGNSHAELEAMLTDLGARFERVERAILGDPEAGHLGAIARLNAIDAQHLGIPEQHAAIDQARIEGDRRIHQRLDKHEEETTARIEQTEREAREHRLNIERKIDRLWWMLLGSTAAGFMVGWGISGFPTP
jgi:hypothetical protein